MPGMEWDNFSKDVLQCEGVGVMVDKVLSQTCRCVSCYGICEKDCFVQGGKIRHSDRITFRVGVDMVNLAWRWSVIRCMDSTE